MKDLLVLAPEEREAAISAREADPDLEHLAGRSFADSGAGNVLWQPSPEPPASVQRRPLGVDGVHFGEDNLVDGVELAATFEGANDKTNRQADVLVLAYGNG